MQLPARLVDALDKIDLAFRAPGRANLIGEHTDYNDGFVLPVALDIATYVAGVEDGDVASFVSLDEPGRVEVDLSTGSGPTEGWGRYVTAVVRALRDEGVELRGFSGAVASDVPTGAGLSSSAALEIAVASALSREPLEPLRLARICRRAENDYVGVMSGIMDQLASAGGRAGHAILIDCRAETMRPVPIPERLSIVVIHSGVQRGLGDSAYNERRAQCETAARGLGVASLRDADVDLLTDKRDRLDQVSFRRARHVVTENARVLAAAGALERGDLEVLSTTFADSHRSLAADYEVSTPELDTLVEITRMTPGVHAARLTGAGFGGCTVQLVERDLAGEAAEEIAARYERATGRTARWWISDASDGVASVT